jgi:hypothetical protein
MISHSLSVQGTHFENPFRVFHIEHFSEVGNLVCGVAASG